MNKDCVKLFQAKPRFPWIVIKLMSLSSGISNDFEKRDLLFLKQSGKSTIALTKNKVTEELLKKEKVCKTSSLGQVFWFTLVRFFKGRLSLKDALSEKSVCWRKKRPLSAINQSLMFFFSYKFVLNFFRKIIKMGSVTKISIYFLKFSA